MIDVGPGACTHIIVIEEKEHLEFSVDSLARDEVLEDVGHLLKSHPLAISGIRH